MSQGDWTIGLWGIKDGKKVYAGTTSNVTIKWNFYEPNVTVQVPVKQNTGDNGYIVLNNVLIYANDEYKNPNYASIVDNQNNNITDQNIKEILSDDESSFGQNTRRKLDERRGNVWKTAVGTSASGSL